MAKPTNRLFTTWTPPYRLVTGATARKRGTQFRIWATNVLRDHILKGYSVNQRRLKELKQSLQIVGNVLGHYDLSSHQVQALLQVVTDYSYALDLLDDYDHQRISSSRVRKGRVSASYC